MRKIFILFFISAVFFYGSFANAQDKNDKPVNHVIAYYFHGNFRCSACRFIEETTESALKEYFDAELKSGKLVFKHVNVEKKENRHFIKDYKLYTKSVVLSLAKDGKEIKWKNLDKVWHLLRDKNKFYNYIKSQTQEFLDNLSEGEQS